MGFLRLLLCCFGIDSEVTEVEDTFNDPHLSNKVFHEVNRDNKDGVVDVEHFVFTESGVTIWTPKGSQRRSDSDDISEASDTESEELPLSTMPYLVFLDETESILADGMLKHHFQEKTAEIACLTQVREGYECSKTTSELADSDLMLEPGKEVLAAARENVQDKTIRESENDAQDFATSNPSLEEFVKTNAAADVTNKEKQEMNTEFLSTNRLCDSPPICSDTDQNVVPLNGNEQHITDEVSEFNEIEKMDEDACSKTINNDGTIGEIQSKRTSEEMEEDRKFNPGKPNFVPTILDPEVEKIDLKHYEMDDRKNSKEWMLDYALRLAVTKLAPARERKVALLVEAFETVLQEPKYEAGIIRHTPTSSSAAFLQTRTIRACS